MGDAKDTATTRQFCTTDDCGGEHYARGMCSRCYSRWKYHTKPEIYRTARRERDREWKRKQRESNEQKTGLARREAEREEIRGLLKSWGIQG